MTPTQKVALWERVNAYAETCGADTSEGAVGADRQRAVVALEIEIEAIEREAEGLWKANNDSWRMVYNAWQDWAQELLSDLGRQPLHGSHGDEPAREVIAQLAGMAAGVPRCLRCGCFSTVHEVDDEELRECTGCECTAFEAPR
jgi:hypothetical protein